jgi:hypothetical protein
MAQSQPESLQIGAEVSPLHEVKHRNRRVSVWYGQIILIMLLSQYLLSNSTGDLALIGFLAFAAMYRLFALRRANWKGPPACIYPAETGGRRSTGLFGEGAALQNSAADYPYPAAEKGSISIAKRFI